MNSGKADKGNLFQRAAARLEPLLPAGSRVLVGLSGGADSVVLLHLLHMAAPRHSWKLSALHVHHGISRNADAWADFCAGLCARYGIPLHIEHVDIAPLRGHGIEAAARKLRHAAFAGQDCDFVALAHHADDQAETLLLQLLRGAGVRGASAMPLLSGREGSPALVRPLLDFFRREILEYAAAHELQWIEDESNADESYPRNFLRHRVLPLLERKFPACRETLARSARHFAEASELLDDLARQDAQLPSSSLSGEEWGEGTLEITRLQSLSPPRARNLMRYFLHRLGAPMPQAAQLDDMLHQLCGARRDAVVCIEYGGSYALCEGGCWQVRRYLGRVYAMRALPGFDRSQALSWNGEAVLEWPALNARLRFDRAEDGISRTKLRHAPVTLRLRGGGETMRPFADGPARTLKNLLQEHHVPPWRRERLPLLYCGDDLVCVPGVAISAEYRADGQEEAIRIELR